MQAVFGDKYIRRPVRKAAGAWMTDVRKTGRYEWMGKKIVIERVLPDSAAADAGIEPGDILLSVNGQKISDIFDYRFLTADSNVVAEIEKKNGEVWEIEIEKDEYEDLGLEFEDPLISGARRCTNNCVFCFIDQLPRGMRETVYFKDDDTRLSFLTGNYVTLTNMKMEELDRIIRYRMTPVNVSVHTTDPELRIRMLGNRFAGDVLEKIKHLTDGGIAVNAQIVLCKGLNDGPQLDKTINDLSALYPGVASISAVPVGLTKWREGLYRLEPFTSEDSAAVIRQVSAHQKRMLDDYGTRLVYLADEFYIKAGMELPSYEEYEDFPQIENGVGLMSLLCREFDDYLNDNGKRLETQWRACAPRTVSIATGRCAAGYIKEMAQTLEKRYNGLGISVYAIENEFFGENVTVTGLLTGQDILGQLKGRELGGELLISRSMLKSGEELFLDDYTVEGLSSGLGVKVTIVENDGADLIRKIMGIN
jgi:putative radical SAM enzyme (TIGR03279 family)